MLPVPDASVTVTPAFENSRPRSSSSVIVSVASEGLATPCPPLAVPDTLTVLFTASTSLSFAVTVTVPVLEVAPAAIVSVVFDESAKSPGTAGETAAAVTVTVTASPDAPDSAAVTVLEPPSSEIDEGESARLTVGVSSSSVIVPVAVAVPIPAPPVAPLSVSVSVSFGSSIASPVTFTVTVFEVSPAAKVSVPLPDV